MNNINTIFTKLETSSICTCQDAMYLHRLYLNIELYVEKYFKDIGRKLEQTSSYHKDLLESYFKSIGLEKSEIYKAIEELRGFRHIFNKRADILEFITDNIKALKLKILSIKKKIIEHFGEIK